MSGHSKWAQIRHKKAITDKKKAQLFSKISKVISLAAKKGPNPEMNLELKNAIEKARSLNMPRESINRAIAKTSDKSNSLEELIIEALGPGGIAFHIKAITDSRNRTINEIKKILSENNSKMVPQGTTSWMFNQHIKIPDQNILNDIIKLLEVLDDNDDVEEVSSNLSEQ